MTMTLILLTINSILLTLTFLLIFFSAKIYLKNVEYNRKWFISTEIASITLDILSCERAASEYHMSLRKSGLETELTQKLNLIGHRLSNLVQRLNRLNCGRGTFLSTLELGIKQRQAITLDHWGDTHLNDVLSSNHEILTKIKSATIDLTINLNYLDIKVIKKLKLLN